MFVGDLNNRIKDLVVSIVLSCSYLVLSKKVNIIRSTFFA